MEGSKTTLNCLMSFVEALCRSGRSRFLWVLLARLVYTADAETFFLSLQKPVLFYKRSFRNVTAHYNFIHLPPNSQLSSLTPCLLPFKRRLFPFKSDLARAERRRVLTRSFVRSIFDEHCFIEVAYIRLCSFSLRIQFAFIRDSSTSN